MKEGVEKWMDGYIVTGIIYHDTASKGYSKSGKRRLLF